MSDVIKKATREGYAEGLLELYKICPDMVVLDADLAAATKTGVFAKAHPDRFFNCGIQECNMMGVAAGMASTGKLVFASSFAMFAAGRAFEIIRNSIAYPKLNVKIGATHGGISVGEDGASHQCNEDIALMRVIPNMTIINPSDDVEARAAVVAMAEHIGPTYLRFGRLATPIFNAHSDYRFELGKGIELKATSSDDVTIVATGLMVAEALSAHDELKSLGINARVINIHTIKPIDREIIVKSAKETGKIVTVEEHSVIGGLGDAVMDVLCGTCPTMKIGVNDRYGYSGPAVELLKDFGLCKENIIKTVKEFIGK
jgi:transketolase